MPRGARNQTAPSLARPAWGAGARYPIYLHGAAAAIGKKTGMFLWLNLWLTLEPPAIRRKSLMISGRSGRILTCDPSVPNPRLYRPQPHSDKNTAYSLG